MLQQLIERRQVRRGDRHIGRRREFVGLADQRRHRVECDRLCVVQQRPQRRVDRRFALAGRQVQNLQVFPHRAPRLLFAQRVIRQAKPRGRKQFFAVTIILERARLADQCVDHVPIVYAMFAPAAQPRQRVDALLPIPDFELFREQPHVHLLANQPAVDGVRVLLHMNPTARIDADPQAVITLQPPLRQRPQHGQLFIQPRATTGVPPRAHLAQKCLVCRAAREVAAAAQQERLLDRLLEVPMRRLAVAVLVRTASVGPRPLQAVVFQQRRVPRVKLPPVRQVVHRRAQPIGAMPQGDAGKFPQRVLQAVAQRLQTLRETDRRRFPVRVGQHRVVHQVIERLSGDRHAQFVHVREVRRQQFARPMDLAEKHFLRRPRCRPPGFHPPLQRPQLTVGKPPRVLPLQPLEQRLGL
jgi:hypothetical protein